MATPVVAPMEGKVLQVKVRVGDRVREDDPVVVIEAMKMEIPIVAPEDGTVREIRVEVGQAVHPDMVLAVLE
ncbi:MAG: acetyl-CoA carboxylase biotin carboxyl carrier protein subunit [Deltaproteobacteria bacterium]|nr:acetyl-CoA carboxylase biotin carboxyl carrier protein subunit [Deltaproteobacteria bacterium]